MSETISASMPDDVEDLVRQVLDLAAEHDIHLATAESCTGGLLASLLTDVEGSSHIFERGFVTYSEASKCDLLGLAKILIDGCGAVSEPVARAMAEGALARSGGDIAVAITGFAGPAGPEDEAGLVHLACARRMGRSSHRVLHMGSAGRGAVRIAAIRAALEMIREAVLAMSAAQLSRA